MNAIKYWEPVGSAWARMKEVLFQPFNLGKWMVMGFVAWFAGLNSGGGSSYNSSSFRDHDNGHLGETMHQVWSQYSTLILAVGSCVLITVVILSILFTWLGARGKFIFLDNALYNRAAVVEPWGKYRMQGNSLFLWKLAIGCIALALLLLIFAICLPLLWPMMVHQANLPLGIFGIIIGMALLFLFIVFFSYLGTFVYDFVVPLMLKYNLGIRAAWRHFFQILKPRFGAFLVYGLIRYLLDFITGLALIAAGLLTCCCLFLVMAIPYIGTVLLLPLFMFYRFLGIEFMRQFGDEFTVDAEQTEADPSLLAEPAP
jgi:hypothetical protein